MKLNLSRFPRNLFNQIVLIELRRPSNPQNNTLKYPGDKNREILLIQSCSLCYCIALKCHNHYYTEKLLISKNNFCS